MPFRLRCFAPLCAFLLATSVAPSSAAVLYDNGPINGNIDAWAVDSVTRVSNSFQLLSPSIITGAVFGAWGYPGRTGVSVEWAITSNAFGTPLASGTSTLSNLFLFNNARGGAVWRESFVIPELALSAGTYWLELDDTWTTGGYWFWWDQNNGPSQAQYVGQFGSGPIASESFQILGEAVPEPGSMTLLGCGAIFLSFIAPGFAGLQKRSWKYC